MLLTRTANLIYDALLTLAYPQVCKLCRGSVETRIYGPACTDCWQATQIFTGNETICWKCGVLTRDAARPIAPEQIRCRRCDSHLFASARACGIYEGALRESVLLLKRQPNLSPHLIDLLVAMGKRDPLNTATRIIPVPLHAEREQQRGFNQATLLAKAIAPALGMVVDETSLIREAVSDKYRAGLDVKGRHETVAGVFAVRFPKSVAGESILLIDDVLTTGATASSCAGTLVAAGAKSVHVLTLARPALPNY